MSLNISLKGLLATQAIQTSAFYYTDFLKECNNKCFSERFMKPINFLSIYLGSCTLHGL